MVGIARSARLAGASPPTPPAPRCPDCDVELELSQPGTGAPEVVLGHCEDCGARWVLADDPPGSRRWTVVGRDGLIAPGVSIRVGGMLLEVVVVDEGERRPQLAAV